MSEFTKGPWKVSDREVLYENSDIYEVHFSDDGECISEITHSKANAQLISAAPDMHHELTETNLFLSKLSIDLMEPVTGETMKRISDRIKANKIALAKAEGDL